MNRFIRLEAVQSDNVTEVMIHIDHIIGVAPVLQKSDFGVKPMGQTWVNTSKFNYKINEPYEIVSAKIESMGAIDTEGRTT